MVTFKKYTDKNAIIQDCLEYIEPFIERGIESEEMNAYTEKQKEVVEELLNTYRNNGVTELENIKTLNVKNFNKFGGLVQIVNNIFGGKEKYNNMINMVETKLYG